MKPENILIDKEGYAIITDFGLSKDNFKDSSGATSFCGTTEYIAPEILRKQQYGKACDYWSFGCVLYEMLTGSPPFYSHNKREIFDKILYGTPNFYNFHSDSAVDLISQLLSKDPACRPNFQEIKEHEFFQSINWDTVYRRKVIPPYIPMLDDDDDLKHFDMEITCNPIDSPNLDNSGGNFSAWYLD